MPCYQSFTNHLCSATVQWCDSLYKPLPVHPPLRPKLQATYGISVWLLFLQQVQSLFSQEVAACHLATVKSGSWRGWVYVLLTGSLPKCWHKRERWRPGYNFNHLCSWLLLKELLYKHLLITRLSESVMSFKSLVKTVVFFVVFTVIAFFFILIAFIFCWYFVSSFVYHYYCSVAFLPQQIQSVQIIRLTDSQHIVLTPAQCPCVPRIYIMIKCLTSNMAKINQWLKKQKKIHTLL